MVINAECCQRRDKDAEFLLFGNGACELRVQAVDAFHEQNVTLLELQRVA